MSLPPCQDRRARSALALPLLALFGLGAGAAATGVSAAQPPAASPLNTRETHRFDFNEPDNFTPVPKYWVPFKTLPSFTVGTFDESTGHEAPPSFYLGLNGRDVAYRYVGPSFETQVHPNSDYHISAWIKPDRLRTARAHISAFYVDREGLPIANSQVFSRFVGGQNDEWQTVSVHLPAGPREAHSIGLTVRVVQQRTWRTGPLPHRFIEQTDVDAGAWFDDIVVYRLPRALITTRAAGNVFVAPQMPAVQAIITDSKPEELVATITLTDAAGHELESTTVDIDSSQDHEGTLVNYRNLTPGIYRATLQVGVGENTLVRRWRTFAYLHEPCRGPGSVSRPFGVVMNGPGQTMDQVALLSALGVGAVKLPLWAQGRDRVGFADATESLDLLLHHLVKARVAMLGVLAGPPSELVRTAGEFPRPLLEILADDPAGWRDPLADVVAPNAGIFRSWQIGGDNDPDMIDPVMQAAAFPPVRKEMKVLMTAPDLTAPGNAHVSPDQGRSPADNISLTIENDVQPEWIPEHLASYQDLGYRHLEVYLETLPPDRYERTAFLADLAKRVVYALHAGVDRVFLHQPWQERTTVNGETTEPTEAFVVYRTAVDLLAEAKLASTLHLSPDVTCLAFDSGQDAVLVLWDDGAGPEGRTHVLQMGAATRQIDLWGHPTPLERTPDGRQRVRLSPVPVFVDGVEQWLVAFLTRLRLEPQQVEFRIGSHVHTVTLAAPVREAISGTVHLRTPPAWEVKPRRFSFALPPGGTLDKEVNIRYTHNEPAGTKTVLAQIEFDSEPRYHVEVPLPVEIGLEGIEVWGYASRRGDRLIIRHGVLNRTDDTISFRGFVVAPGRTRQYRVFNAMFPGRTIVTEYAFDNGADLAGRVLRLGLREVGGRRAHNLEITVP
ncbi:MAG: hypothetical protein JSV19_11580 [Phycisphaerales bacterium]|nr:MAG: hypothetical protein JSV19_11580 [Phycisphaerales bacterium]